jgi:hypothetical protein
VGPTQCPNWWVTGEGGSFPGGKVALAGETYHLPRFNDEATNEWSWTHAPPTFIYVLQTDSFTLTVALRCRQTTTFTKPYPPTTSWISKNNEQNWDKFCFKVTLLEPDAFAEALGIISESPSYNINHTFGLLLYLYRARNKITQLSIPTHAQLQRHRLKFIKNHLKTPTCFGLRPFSVCYNVLAKITIILTTVECFYAKSGDLAACRVVCIGLYLKIAWVYLF